MEPTQEPADREVFLEDQGQAFDRMRGKRITDQAGNVIETADKPLSEHRGHGAAKRRPPTDPAA